MVAKVEVPATEISPVVVSVVKVGVVVTPMVEVPEKMTLAPAVRYDTGELKKEFQLDDEAVRGIAYPAWVPRVKVWTPDPALVVMIRSSPPEVEVARVWEATEDPLREVMLPPAPPASVPQVNVPLAQRSFSVEVLQALRLAPKSEAILSAPVPVALVK